MAGAPKYKARRYFYVLLQLKSNVLLSRAMIHKGFVESRELDVTEQGHISWHFQTYLLRIRIMIYSGLTL